ncbi:MAG: nitroreductase [Vicingaceae bacterium]
MKLSINEASQLIQQRQSLYPAQMQAGEKIPDADIWKLLENANYAPSHKRTEPWRYIVFSGDALHHFFEEMGKIYQQITPQEEVNASKIEKFKTKAAILSHLIAICMKRDEKEQVPIEEEEYSVAASVQNMLLSMKPLNIIGYWGTGKIAFSKEMKSYLNLGEKDKCMGFLQLGVPKEGLPEISKKQMSPIQDKVEWR